MMRMTREAMVLGRVGLIIALAFAGNVHGAGFPRLVLGEALQDFGKVAPRSELQVALSLTNAGTSRLEIRQVHGSCSCVRPRVLFLDVMPGTNATLLIGFITSDLSGPFTESLSFTSNDPAHPDITVQFRGTVFRRVEAVPDFAVLAITPDSWTNETVAVRILNHGDTAISVSEPVAANNAFAAALSTIRPGYEFGLEMRAARALPNGNHYGRFTLKTSSIEVPQIEVTAYVPGLSAVVASPRRVVLPSLRIIEASVRAVFIRGTTDQRLVVSDPVCDLPGVKVTLEEREAGRLFVALVRFPGGFELPAERKAEVVVKTNHPQFPTLRIPVVAVDRPRGDESPAAKP